MPSGAYSAEPLVEYYALHLYGEVITNVASSGGGSDHELQMSAWLNFTRSTDAFSGTVMQLGKE